ncbi:NADH:ubiquinone oxidoreductase 11.6kD subunit [Coemansia reversa NRRL 1564]|uniref:NADH dehydrogenase [ubiquinone] 1 beta subcomplex subunit 11, mitochondrial n=1 Tax=Coemansia reversa (strain ATCC 12441 / NRRL 1564) TaxID=763665 RepID=A0A2G5BBQ1_COERN|nr:NADH:ubiquinone oxidoreductase 11.6kD subunit [Coemansia reversa NRRL 1564]|eukprot:PIA16436.1 NADH:ubiquinone oxidoreductase 11.6kD subunit [Coemansia reversa NRRL 1564]
MFAHRLVRLSTRNVTIPSRLVRGGHGAPQFNEPGGYLFGRKPGEKLEKEGWETIWGVGFGTAFVMIALGLYYKPDTRIRTWAREEAERQMREEGDHPDYKRTDYRA